MTPVDVVPCGAAEAPAVHALTQAAFAGYGVLDPPSGALAETVESVAADLAAYGGALALVAAEPVGCLRLSRHEGCLFVRRVAVHPAWQGRGVGRALMRWIEERAVALGEPELRLGVRPALTGNRDFYARLGYREVAEHLQPDGSPFWVELAKPLTA